MSVCASEENYQDTLLYLSPNIHPLVPKVSHQHKKTITQTEGDVYNIYLKNNDVSMTQALCYNHKQYMLNT